jgi:hypothetical protein
MILHTIRFTLKPNAPKDQVEVVFEQLRKCDREIKAVQYFCVGRDFGGEFEYGAMYAFQDIGGYRDTCCHRFISRPTNSGRPS